MKKTISITLAVLLLLTIFTGCNISSNENPNSIEELHQSTLEIPVQVFDVNPLTGEEKGDNFPEGQRPVAIMINNLPKALPQAGIIDADVIFEMVTEGGITRLMAIYDDISKVRRVGPIRSTRDQFVQLLLPINAINVHIGSSIFATEMLRKYEYITVDGVYLGTTTFQFDQNRSNLGFANEHCFYTDAVSIWNGISENNIDPKGGTIKLFDFVNPDTPARTAELEASSVAFDFSSVSDASFVYDTETKKYKKFSFDVPHIDENTGEQISFDNVIIISTTVTLKMGGPCTDFDYISGGEGYYFTNGSYEKITWKKSAEDKPLELYSLDGTSLKVNRGKSYISVVDKDTLASTLTINGQLATQAVVAE